VSTVGTAALDALEALAVPAGAGCCGTCHGPTWPPGAPTCPRCTENARSAAGLVAGGVVPVTVALSGSRLAGALWRYKAGPAPGRAPCTAALAALLAAWLAAHRDCLLAGTGLVAPLVTAVPSRSGATHLPDLLAAAGLACDALPWRFVRPARRPAVLSPGPGLRGVVEGRDALVVDDTWTTGRTAQRAVDLLCGAGARRVGVLVLARHVSVGHPGALPYLDRFGRPWRVDRCVGCDPPG
jgi:hypothetical protein